VPPLPLEPPPPEPAQPSAAAFQTPGPTAPPSQRDSEQQTFQDSIRGELAELTQLVQRLASTPRRAHRGDYDDDDDYPRARRRRGVHRGYEVDDDSPPPRQRRRGGEEVDEAEALRQRLAQLEEMLRDAQQAAPRHQVAVAGGQQHAVVGQPQQQLPVVGVRQPVVAAAPAGAAAPAAAAAAAALLAGGQAAAAAAVAAPNNQQQPVAVAGVDWGKLEADLRTDLCGWLAADIVAAERWRDICAWPNAKVPFMKAIRGNSVRAREGACRSVADVMVTRMIEKTDEDPDAWWMTLADFDAHWH
jgi:hypothetical protein